MKKITLIMMLFTAMVSSAQSFTVGTINYKVTSTTAPLTVEVAQETPAGVLNTEGTTQNSGAVVIPETVTDPTTSLVYTVTRIGDRAFEENKNITSVVMPNTITEVGLRAFIRNTKMTSLTLSNTLATIRTLAFFGINKVTTITIPASVTTIETRAFEQCLGLTEFNVKNLTPVTIVATTFTATPITTAVTLKVPSAAAKTAYEGADVWKTFFKIEIANLSISHFDTSNLKVFPNPAEGELNVSHSSLISKVTLYDVTGKEIYNDNVNSNAFNLNVSSFSKGLYLLKLTDDANATTVEKITIK